jgi:hypothetical protein
MDSPKDIGDQRWWMLIGIAGTLIGTVSAAGHFRSGLVTGLALLLFGVGQWRDHPIVTSRGQDAITTSYPWRPSILGVILSVIGVVLFPFGMSMIVTGG